MSQEGKIADRQGRSNGYKVGSDLGNNEVIDKS